MEFSKSQKEAINTKSVNILVQAAAGSGKTRVLVEKIIRLVCGIEEKKDGSFANVEKVPVDKILVMTFTNNATNEMKNRIKKGLADIIREKEKNGEDVDELEYQLSMVNNANIQTIDSFCKEIIDHNFTRLEKLDPKYRIAEDKELELLRYDVQSEILEKYYGDDKYKDFLKLYFNKDDERLRNMLDKGLFYISSKAFSKKYIDDLKDNFDANNKKAILDYKKNVVENLKLELKSKIDNISRLYDDVKNVTPKVDNEKNRNIIDKNIIAFDDFINKIKKLYINVDDDILIENVIEYEKKIGVVNITKTGKDEVEFKGGNQGMGVTLDSNSNIIFKKFKKEFSGFHITKKSYLYTHVNIIKNLVNITDEQIHNDNELLYLDMLKDYYENYENAKLEKKVLDIGDLQKYVLELLYDKKGDKYVYSEFANVLSDKYKYIFIDEYQDTSIIQEKIIEALSKGYTNKNVFMVGDVKQSIYRFRNADINIFNEKFYAYGDENDKNNRLIPLSTNYRSSENVIDFVNELFSDVMTLDATKIDYKKDNMLFHGRDEKNIYEDVEINEFYKNIDKNVEYDLLIGKDRKCSIKDEANLVACIVKDLHDNKHIPYGDIVILLRKEKNTFLHYMESMQNMDIPAICTMKEGFYDSYEIQLMIDILSVIDNPYDDIRLASVLTSCIIDITNNELAFLKKEYDKHISTEKPEYFQLEDAVQCFIKRFKDNKYNDEKRYIDDYDVDIVALYRKLDYYDTMFNKYRDLARYKSISDLIYIICDKTNIMHLINNMSLGNLRVSNIKLLMSKAKSYESTSFVGLNNFIRYLERIKEQEIDDGMAQVLNDNDDMVHITTIHKSKGLEYKVVILPNLVSKYNEKSYLENDKRDNSVCFNDEYGVSLNYVNYKKRLEYVTPKRSLIDEIEKKESISEEMRILYVALTRAREKLILVDRVVSEKKRDELFPEVYDDIKLTKEDIWGFNSYSKLINHTINRLKKDNKIVFNQWNIDDIKDVEKSDNFDKEVENIDIINSEYLKDGVDKYSKDNLAKNESFVDRYYFLTKIKPKISVSDIKSSSFYNSIKNSKKTESNDEEYDVKDNDEKAIDIKSTDIGNLYHRFMELYTFSGDIEKELYNMIEKGLIENEAKKVLNIDKIKVLSDSHLGVAMKKAYDNKLFYSEKRFMKYFKRSEIENYKNIDDRITINGGEDVNIIVQGIVDAFFIEEDNGKKSITLIDYKTDGIINNNVSENILKDRYKVQLDIYKKALEETTGIKVNKKILYSFTMDKAIEV